jgi:hypothetical protein
MSSLPCDYDVFTTTTRWARCSAGSRGWYWYVKPPVRSSDEKGIHWGDELPTASGFEPTAELAEAKAREAAGEDCHQEPAKWAEEDLRRVAVEKRMARKPKDTRHTATVELIWHADLLSADYGTPGHEPSRYVYTPYRVVKKTARHVYVDRERYDIAEAAWATPVDPDRKLTWRDYDIKTFTLDRKKLESGEGTWSHSFSREYNGEFFPTRELAEKATRSWAEMAERVFGGRARSPEEPKEWWAKVLGLTVPYSTAAVKNAYRRLAKESHPDAGGDAAEFMRIENAYQAALRSVRTHEGP